MNKLLAVTVYTAADRLRQRSLYVILACALVFLFVMRGCFNANFMMNNREADNLTVVWHTARIAFQLITGAVGLLAVFFSMGRLARDGVDGSALMFLSRPVSRAQYVLGRLLGDWLMLTLLMFLVHLAIFLSVLQKTGGQMPGLLTGSLICSLVILFILALTLFLSLFMPDFAAALASLTVLAVGFASETIFLAARSEFLQRALQSQSLPDVAQWRVLYPKATMVLYWAVSRMGEKEFNGMGAAHPALNLALYTALLMGGLVLAMGVGRRSKQFP